jgi:hypothetical protein
MTKKQETKEICKPNTTQKEIAPAISHKKFFFSI